MRKNFLVFGSPDLQQAEIDEVVSAMESGWIGTGPLVHRFESDFSSYKRSRQEQVAAVNSCTAALHLSLLAAGIGPGDEVITSALTFCATVNSIIHCGATPVLADVEPVSMNIDPDDIERRITPRTKAILPVHFAGRPCDMNRIIYLGEKYGLKIIEDCAHAVEAEYEGRPVGTIGDFGCFSFYVTKNITSGEGGMIIARSEENIKHIKMLALHGLSHDAWQRYSDSGFKHYTVTECGYKYNMMDLQAAIGIHQLQRVEEGWKHREMLWHEYQHALQGLPLVRPADPEEHVRHAFHLYTVLLEPDYDGLTRDELLNRLHDRQIGTGVHYLGIPEHPYYQERYGWKAEDWPVATHIGRHTLSLPLSPKVTRDDQRDVIEAIAEILQP